MKISSSLLLWEQLPYFSRQVHVENVRYARDPVTYPRPLPGTFQMEGKEKKGEWVAWGWHAPT